VFNMQGRGVPLIDFCILCHHTPAQALYSTRVILLDCHDQQGQEQRLALLTEGVTGTIRYQEDAIHRLDINLIKAPYLAEVVTDNKGIVQLLDVDALYTTEIAVLLKTHAKNNNE
ncbi:MAG: chemotaxis protein CheW, partial [Mariprofundaceae bacterium]|nr:chemotaxis protein CheW [Mariprofundaceae bacterium]